MNIYCKPPLFLSIKKLLSITILGASLLTAQATYATVADGVYAYENGDYQQARAEWLPYAALGNPNALYNLGQLSRMGRGVEQSFLKAEEYYLRAAEKGHVGAQRNLGTFYYFGRIDGVDYAKALDWLRKAAINGDHKAQLMTGSMYFNGQATEKNMVHAYAWIQLAAQSGLTKAAESINKLEAVMTPEQIIQAKELATSLTSRQLSPDDVGLMVGQQGGEIPAPELNSMKQKETITPRPENLAVVAANDGDAPENITPDSDTHNQDNAIRDNYRVQLGSYHNEEAAQKAQKTLEKKLSPIMTGRQVYITFADLGDKGAFYRLQLGHFNTRHDAGVYCSQLKDQNQNCYVLKTP